MKKMFLAGAIGVGLLLAVTFGIYLMKMLDDKASLQRANTDVTKVVTVDNIVRHPDRFKSSIGVVGKVIKVDESDSLFVMGCEDACVMMPVRYRAQMPKLGDDIIVYGAIKVVEGGRYVFEGQKIKEK